MTDERFEGAVHDLLAERGRTTNGDVRSVLAGIEHLPERSGGRRSWLAAAAAVAILVLGGGLALGRLALPGIGSGDDRVGRAAFASDPRLAGCEAQIGATAAQVFEMTHAEWFPLYFPGWYRGAPELLVDDPALVVIGPTFDGPFLGGPPPPGTTPDPAATPRHAFQMCIAIGPAGDAALHAYGPTWFDRIVPVLSQDDVARAAHLDPDVLADPTAWRFPERLAPCGGLTGNELYIFEATHLSDLRLIFPSGGFTFADDDPAAVIVYRDPLPGRIGFSLEPDRHDVCIALEVPDATPDHLLIPEVDTRGLHVRIDDELDQPPILAPGATPFPSAPAVTPEPLPAWAGDAAGSLQCDGPPSAIGPTGPQEYDRLISDPGKTVDGYLAFVRAAAIPFPADGFVERDGATGARLYTYDVGGRTRAVILAGTEDGTETGRWRIADVASCDPSEFDPRTPIGGGVHVWTDPSGGRVRTDQVFERADCYGATKLTVLGRLFLRDPAGAALDPGQLDAAYAASVQLPKDALWLGFLDGAKAMWTAKDGTAVFIVDGSDTGHAERLPHVKGDEIQRIDCN
jgi:hypothetical protein